LEIAASFLFAYGWALPRIELFVPRSGNARTREIYRHLTSKGVCVCPNPLQLHVDALKARETLNNLHWPKNRSAGGLWSVMMAIMGDESTNQAEKDGSLNDKDEPSYIF
jgi:hypothetical protein